VKSRAQFQLQARTEPSMRAAPVRMDFPRPQDPPQVIFAKPDQGIEMLAAEAAQERFTHRIRKRGPRSGWFSDGQADRTEAGLSSWGTTERGITDRADCCRGER